MSVHRRVEARNRGLDRVSRLTTLTLSGGLVLSGGFAALAGHAYAGHSRRSVPSLAGNTRARATGSVTPGGTVAPLTAPQTVPQAAPQTVPQTVPQYNYQYQPPPDPVVSGGS